MQVDACGYGPPPPRGNTYGFPSLFVCDPSIPAPVGCSNPFHPSSTQFTGSALTTPTAPRATISLPSTSASLLYMTVAAVPGAAAQSLDEVEVVSRSVGVDPLPTFSLSLSALGSAPYLVASGNVSIVSTGGADAALSWTPPLLTSADGLTAIPARGMTFDVFIAPGGFAAVSATVPLTVIVPGTACGLDRWAYYFSAGDAGAGAAVLRGMYKNSILLSSLGLVSGQMYEFAVVAVCNISCWSSSGGGAWPSPSSFTAQRAAYGLASLNITGPPPGPSSPGGTSLGVLGVSVLGGLCGALVLGGVCFIVYRRSGGFSRGARRYDMLVARDLAAEDGFDGAGGDDVVRAGGYTAVPLASGAMGAPATAAAAVESSPPLAGVAIGGSQRPKAQRITQLRASLSSPVSVPCKRSLHSLAALTAYKTQPSIIVARGIFLSRASRHFLSRVFVS